MYCLYWTVYLSSGGSLSTSSYHSLHMLHISILPGRDYNVWEPWLVGLKPRTSSSQRLITSELPDNLHVLHIQSTGCTKPKPKPKKFIDGTDLTPLYYLILYSCGVRGDGSFRNSFSNLCIGNFLLKTNRHVHAIVASQCELSEPFSVGHGIEVRRPIKTARA